MPVLIFKLLASFLIVRDAKGYSRSGLALAKELVANHFTHIAFHSHREYIRTKTHSFHSVTTLLKA